MIEIRRDGERYELTLSEDCRAPADVVYALLTDLSTHMEWGGSWHPSRTQRLMSMDAPARQAIRGMEFESTGSAGGGCWHDRSKVTEVEPSAVFEFETRGTMRDGQGVERMKLHAIHRYQLAPLEPGTRITYTCSATLTLASSRGDHHPRLPAVIFNLVVPAVVERGTKNLILMAEERAGLAPVEARPGPRREPLPEGAG